MKTRSAHFLVNAAGNLMQQHAFDHLPDEKLSRMHRCISALNQNQVDPVNTGAEKELFELCLEANLYTDTATPQAMQQWLTLMNHFGRAEGECIPAIVEQADV